MTDKNKLHNLSREVKEIKYYVLDELKHVDKKVKRSGKGASEDLLDLQDSLQEIYSRLWNLTLWE